METYSFHLFNILKIFNTELKNIAARHSNEITQFNIKYIDGCTNIKIKQMNMRYCNIKTFLYDIFQSSDTNFIEYKLLLFNDILRQAHLIQKFSSILCLEIPTSKSTLHFIR